MQTNILFSRVLLITGALAILFSQTALGEISPRVKENIDLLTAENKCIECDLSGANLNRLNLVGADLQGADLSNAKLFLTNLAGANLKGANLRGAKFGGADLAGADLTGAQMEGAKLSGAYLVGAIIDEVKEQAEKRGEGTVVEQQEKKGDTSTMAISNRRDYEETPPQVVAHEINKPTHVQPVKDVTPASKTAQPMAEAIVSAEEEKGKIVEEQKSQKKPPVVEKYIATAKQDKQEKVEASQVPAEDEVLTADGTQHVTQQKVNESPDVPSQTVEPEIKEQDLVRAKPEKVSKKEIEERDRKNIDKKEIALTRLLKSNRCYGCDLSSMDLSDKNLDEADLEAAIFTNSNLEGVDLSEANLKGANFSGAILRDANLKEADLYKADFSKADMTGADLKDAKIDEAVFFGAKGLQMESVLIAE